MKTHTHFSRAFACAILSTVFANATAQAAEIVGAGSSAAAPLYGAWGQEWASIVGSTLKYAPVGSGAGIKAIQEGKGDFGASDVALPKEALDKYDLVNFPVAISGVLPIVHLPNLPRGELKLTGAVLADIFAGKITQWNAPQIVALNRGLSLPNLPIRIIGREDGSGTTYVFSNYLTKVSDGWAKDFGNDFKIKWPASAKLVKGTSAMIAEVTAQTGAIGYAESGQVDAARLNYARVANQKGNYPTPNATSFMAAIAGSAWSTSGNFEEMLTNAPDRNAWPITGGTFVIMQKHVVDAKRSETALSLFTYGFAKGDALASKLHWVPLPERTQARVMREMAKMVDAKGLPLSWRMSY